MHRVLCAFAAASLLASASSAEVFKCTAKNGLPLYQNFPCDIDSLGALRDSSETAKAAAPIKSIQADARFHIAPGSPGDASSRAPPGEPRIGMTAAEVKAAWGAPEEIVQDEPRAGRVEIWQYADGRTVQIDRKQRVVSIQR